MPDTPKVVIADLEYPRTEGAAKAILIRLVDTRAADNLLIEYDFNRDGWVIKQSKREQWTESEGPGWTEVAFIKAWGLIDR